MKPQRRDRRDSRDGNKSEFETKVVEIKRVTRVVAGGKRMRFRALVVSGDKKGRVGIGLKKGADVAEAVSKAGAQARKLMARVPIKDGTIPYALKYKYKAAMVFLKPARPGSGITAGAPVRAVLTLAGIKNISSKMLGASNKVSNVRATFEALKSLKAPPAEEAVPSAK